MKQIDWRKMPDATHMRPAGDGYQEHWIKPGYFCVTGFEPSWVKSVSPDAVRGAIPRPVEWDGEGLPPIGLKVEAYFPSDSTPTWLPTVLLYVSEENVIYSGDEEGEEIRRSRPDFDALQVKFRPIRTAEQIAAEDREKDAESLFDVIHPDGKWYKADSLYKERFRAAIDAGYRKQVQQ